MVISHQTGDREPVVVVTTVGSPEEARAMARSLVERRLAACAQITPIESFYRWKGVVENEPEWRIVFKTVRSRCAELEQAIRELHTYELPAIHTITLDAVYSPYADWIAESCRESD